jgi:hypothetical protein
MISLILIKSALILNPVRKKDSLINVFCSCKDSNSPNNHIFPYAPFNYSKNYDDLERKDSGYDQESEEPEHISIDNLYLENVGPEVIVDPYSEPTKEVYGPYSD